jgi:hypothetical protein
MAPLSVQNGSADKTPGPVPLHHVRKFCAQQLAVALTPPATTNRFTRF